MKTAFRKYLLLFLGIGLFLTARQTKASHVAGSEIIYVNIAPNVYVINYSLYRNCAGALLPNTQMISYRAPGCDNTVRTATLTLGSLIYGSPYCNNTLNTCSGSSPLNFIESKFSGTITLPTQCVNWLVTGQVSYRHPTGNLANYGVENLYSEALINNQIPQLNHSPSFGFLYSTVVGVDKTVTYNNSVEEEDGDSLYYSLKPALHDINTPVAYGSYAAGTSPAGTPYPAGAFSATNPIVSENPVALNALTGTVTFKPLRVSIAPGSTGNNYYAMVMQVDEFRKINGVATKIGHVRRDMIVVVEATGTNQLPRIDTFKVNGIPVTPETVVPVYADQPVTILVTPTDADLANVVTLTLNAAKYLPGATYTVSSGSRPTGTITWTPTQADIREYPYYFTATATDDNCPVKGFQSYALGLRVKQGTLTGISKNLPANSFTAYPNPSNNQQITFKIKPDYAVKNAEILIYNVAGKIVDRIEMKAESDQLIWHKKADLPAGVYFAMLSTSQGSQTIKLVHLK